MAFHDELFARQPPLEGDGWDEQELAVLGTDLGVPQSVLDCMGDGQMDNYVAAQTSSALASGVRWTPGLLVNGELVDTASGQSFDDALNTALEAADN
ncbi:MAG: DsbA family protein [Actinomycetales bacterium]